MIKEIKLKPNEANSENFYTILAEKLKTNTFVVLKKSLDARSKYPYYIIRVAIGEPLLDTSLNLKNVSKGKVIHIIGAGPAGMFAALRCIVLGYKPILIERGKSVKERRRDIAILNKELFVNTESNYCYGEGGAGTYSDGKLYTRSKKRGNIHWVLNAFVKFGAPENIMFDAKPHIGTNKLPGIIENMRNTIIECGGEVWFNSKVTDITHTDKIKHITINNTDKVEVDKLILATGHSARDVFEILNNQNILIEVKPFALGVRIEHKQEVINKMLYNDAEMDNLPNGYYQLVEQVNGAGVFSFCMCPGGIIANASTGSKEIVVNGWSPSKRNGKFANSGFVSQVDNEDFKEFSKFNNLMGMAYQGYYENAFYNVTNSIVSPAQRMEDFIQGIGSSTLPECSYIPGITSVNLHDLLPQRVAHNLKLALEQLGKTKKWYRTNEAVLVGLESRTSSPVKIPRNEDCEHVEISNLYPCGEGAGYAGGILSAAMDGINVVDCIFNKHGLK